jgi:hypothetical protein
MKDLNNIPKAKPHLPYRRQQMPRLPVVPENDAPPVLSLSPSARLMALYILAASRTGKSRLMGRGIVWSDYYYAIPQIVIDATGTGTIDNFLDKFITRLQYVENHRTNGFYSESNT